MIVDDKRITFYEKSLDRVNYWLQFAETKHAALIAFVIAVLAVIYSSDNIINAEYKIILTIGYTISLGISLLSFLPIYKFNIHLKMGEYLEKDNILFWGDICKYTLDDYMFKVNREIFTDKEKTFTKEEELFSEEILINSRIANRKYKLFKYSLFVVILFTILLPVFIIIVA